MLCWNALLVLNLITQCVGGFLSRKRWCKSLVMIGSWLVLFVPKVLCGAFSHIISTLVIQYKLALYQSYLFLFPAFWKNLVFGMLISRWVNNRFELVMNWSHFSPLRLLFCFMYWVCKEPCRIELLAITHRSVPTQGCSINEVNVVYEGSLMFLPN